MAAVIKSVFADSVYSRCNDVINIGHIAFLYDHSQLMFAFMSQLVAPQFSENVDRAAVTFDLDDRAYLFEVNKEFWQSINFYEQCFVLAHEILHALLDHGLRGREYLKLLFKTNKKYFLMNEDVLNTMMDIEINEALVSSAYGFDRNLISFAGKSCFIDTVFSQEIIDKESLVADREFEDYGNIYLKYAEEFDLSALLSLLFNNMGFLSSLTRVDEDGNIEFDPEKFSMDDHVEENWDDVMRAQREVMDNFFEGQKVEASDILNNSVTVLGNKSAYGYGSVGNYAVKLDDTKSLDDVFDISMKALNKRVKSSIREVSWTNVNRRFHSSIAAIDPNIAVPSYRKIDKKDDDKRKILVYMDTSYSCFDYIKKLMELVKGLDEDKYDVEAYIFAGHVAPIDLNKPKFFSGGTDIDRVYKHAVSCFDKQDYDGVFVLTDGEFSNCYSSYDLDYKKWSWFLVPSYDSSNISSKSKFHKVSKI